MCCSHPRPMGSKQRPCIRPPARRPRMLAPWARCSGMRPCPLVALRRSRPRARIGSMPASAVTPSSSTRRAFSTASNGAAKTSTRTRMCLGLCWKCRTACWARARRSASGRAVPSAPMGSIPRKRICICSTAHPRAAAGALRPQVCGRLRSIRL